MTSIEDLKKVREEKLNILKENGIDAYPSTVNRTHEISELVNDFETLEKKGEEVRIVGRVMSLRGQGKIFFSDLYDGTGKFQVVFRIDNSPKYTGHDDIDGLSFFAEVADIGDFIEVGGKLFITKSGQQSIDVSDWRMLTKSLAPIPDGFYGLKDDDERYRKRYLDLLLNEDLKDLFKKKEIFWNTARDFMVQRGFLEVETPTLEITTGGAEARPFTTHHNDFDIPVHLRISVGELWQKRLMAAGFAKVFEIGRVYRNEGSSHEHLQEFTNMEFYSSFTDYKEGMGFVEEMVKEVAYKTFGKLKFDIKGNEVDLDKKWEVIEYVPYVEEKTGINVLTASVEEMKEKLQELGVSYEGENRERLTDTLWKYCRKTISGPVWLIKHPKLVSPLAKSVIGNEDVVERCQLILAGSEFCNGFSELNDPLDQKDRFELQNKLIESGDEEAMMPDWEFVEMLEHGMPPTFGCAPIGDRMFAFFAGTSVREAQLFPLMKPKNTE